MTPVFARRLTALLGSIGLLAAIASAAGVLLRGDMSTVPFTTVRGETIDVVTTGIYRWNSLPVVSEGVGWDLVTLLLVVPVLGFALRGVWRGSLPARLLATGLMAYFVYQYLEYAMFWAYGPLFPVHVATFALSLVAIALLVSSFDLAELAAGVSTRFPRRAVAGLGGFMGALLTLMWLPLVARSLGADLVPELAGATTLTVQALDLGLLVPLGLATAVTVLQRRPIGYVLAAVVTVKATAMGAAIAAMLVVEALNTGELAAIPIALFAAISVVGGLIGARVFGSIGRAHGSDEPERRTSRTAPLAAGHR